MQLLVRKAELKDVKTICEILQVYANQQIVLARDEADITYYLKNFSVCEVDGIVRGCVALRDFGNELMEVRSLAVNENFKGMGIGRAMLNFLIEKVKKEKKDVRIFALTYQDKFFQKMGFHVVEKELFPEKIWADCEKCPKKHHCDEIAVLLEIKN
ncbi:MAG: N-acetyltransferase [Lentisphaeria bacterium]|nr:N-acetyltransferase [Lentisphaeria bacterium]